MTSRGIVHAVNDVLFFLFDCMMFGIVGEIGFGKSVTIRLIVGLLWWFGCVVVGSAKLDGADLIHMLRRELRRYWGSVIGYVG